MIKEIHFKFYYKHLRSNIEDSKSAKKYKLVSCAAWLIIVRADL